MQPIALNVSSPRIGFVYIIILNQRQRDIPFSNEAQGRFIYRETDRLRFWEAKYIVLIYYLQKSHAINGVYYENLLNQLGKSHQDQTATKQK